MNQNLGDISNVSTKEVNELFEFGGDEVRSHVKPVKMHLWRSSGQGQTRENDRYDRGHFPRKKVNLNE